jgi:hypothetical protein
MSKLLDINTKNCSGNNWRREIMDEFTFYFYILFLTVLLCVVIPLQWRKKRVKNRILLIENYLRQARGAAAEEDLGTGIEASLDTARSDLTDLLAGKKLGFALKGGERVDGIFDRLEETAKALLQAVQKKNKERVSAQLRMLRAQIGDLRTEFRR